MRFKKALFLFVLPLLLPAFAGAACPAEVLRTGQTTCYRDNGPETACADTGQVGDNQSGIAWPEPRFNDHDGTTTIDNLTGLMWPKNANVPDMPISWQMALDYVAGMNAGTQQGSSKRRCSSLYSK